MEKRDAFHYLGKCQHNKVVHGREVQGHFCMNQLQSITKSVNVGSSDNFGGGDRGGWLRSKLIKCAGINCILSIHKMTSIWSEDKMGLKLSTKCSIINGQGKQN